MLRIKTDINGKLELKEESVKVAKGMLTVSGKEGPPRSAYAPRT